MAIPFVTSLCQMVSFGGDTKRLPSLLSGVCARGSKRSHTGVCVSVNNLPWIPPLLEKDNCNNKPVVYSSLSAHSIGRKGKKEYVKSNNDSTHGM